MASEYGLGMPRVKAQNRHNVQQLKLIGQSHQTGLTANLLKLFEPRPPLEYKPPIEKKRSGLYTGVGQFVERFAEPDDPEYQPPITKAETKAQRKTRIQEIKLAKGAEMVQQEIANYDPHNDPSIEGDPYKTLFVARVSYETTEHKLKREFEAFGPVRKVRLITDINTDKPRGYAFVEYHHTRDMKTAYKQGDGKKIDNRRVIVDVERGRTVPNWRPRRLGGGLGSTRLGGDDLNQRHSGREPTAAARPPVDDRPPREEEHHREERVREERIREERPREREDRFREDRIREERGRDIDDRDRERRDRDRDHDKPREPDRERDRSHRDRDRDRDRDRGRNDRERGSDRHRERERDRDAEHNRAVKSHSRERERDR